MLNKLFKKASTNIILAATPTTPSKSMNELIEEIHESFFTEVDKLLEDAKIERSIDTDKQDLIGKCNRLKALGFTSSKEVKEAEAEITRLDKLKKENEEKKTLIEAINYFSFKYPNYKFITEESVKKICAKYNLVYGEIKDYIGTVPDKNLKHIEDFKISEDDECYIYKESIQIAWGSAEVVSRLEFIGIDLFNKYQQDLKYGGILHWSERKINMKCPLEIAAPSKDFNMTGKEVKDHKVSKIEIPDPVVLKPVIFNGQKHYLIVTAWGLEASDELVVNPTHN